MIKKRIKVSSLENHLSKKKVAEEHSALLALHHFGPKQPLERRLPEPFKAIWLSLGTTTSQINTASKYSTKREKRVANTSRLENYARKRNQREAKKLVRKLYRVQMEEELRIYVENILNGNTNMLKKNQNNEENASELSKLLLKQVTDMLTFDGFSPLDADLAIKNTFKVGMERDELYSKSVNHLMLILSEDQLPAKYLAGSVGMWWESYSEKSEYLLEKFIQQQENRDYKAMQYVRGNLPASRQEEKIMKIINKNQVLVISGETGCGKSTQIPQFILDDALKNGRGSSCNIVCTQPRRISAIGLAERVSSERAENVGETVGYNIRLENKTSEQTQICYCTCGILLRRLSFSLNIGQTSHVVVDEVHERSVEIDILLKLLKDLLHHRKDLKVILMSATLNAKVFSEYFDGAPVMHIPGRTFPVETYFLQDILRENPRFNLKRATWIKRTKEEERMRRENYVQNGMKLELATQLARYDEGEQHKVDLDLVTVCVRTILESYEHDLGAILIFMPGTWEINTCCRNIEKRFGRDYDLWVLPLHSSLSTKNQKQIFRKPPRGTRKIVISTNIAETSITVDDVRFVIDTGKMKEVQYDPRKKLQQLVETWCAGANSVQRRGRAGRVSKGICFHL